MLEVQKKNNEHLIIISFFFLNNRVEVLSNKNVSSFGPPLPSPPLFHDQDTLKAFLTLKRNVTLSLSLS